MVTFPASSSPQKRATRVLDTSHQSLWTTWLCPARPPHLRMERQKEADAGKTVLLVDPSDGEAKSGRPRGRMALSLADDDAGSATRGGDLGSAVPQAVRMGGALQERARSCQGGRA